MWVATIATTGLLVSLVLFVRMRKRVVGTTLVNAWNWGLAAWLTWLAAWVVDCYLQSSDGVRDQLWFAAAILMPCPLIAVLGARNPGAHAWTAFVLVPLILVLGWPAATVWEAGQPRPLLLEGPTLMGFVVVAVMGAGNYFGTRFTLSACGVALSLLLTIAPFSGLVPFELTGETVRSIAAFSLVASCLFTAGCLAEPLPDRRPSPTSSPELPASLGVVQHDGHYDRLWLDFRDYFGIVWAKRVMDRLNGLFARDSLPVRMDIDGLHWSERMPDDAERAEIYVQADRSIRWLLRRFADDAWIDQRLPSRK